MSIPQARVQDQFRTAVELHEFGVAMMRQRFSRANPDWGPELVEELVLKWLHTPKADSPGEVERTLGRLPPRP